MKIKKYELRYPIGDFKLRISERAFSAAERAFGRPADIEKWEGPVILRHHAENAEVSLGKPSKNGDARVAVPKKASKPIKGN